MQHFHGLAVGCARTLMPLVLLFPLVSCGEPQSKTSKLYHNADEPVRLGQVGLWQEVSADSFEKVYLPTLSEFQGRSAISYLAPDDQKSQLVGEWLARYDEHLRGQFPELLAAIPEPKPLVVVNRKVNAAVIPIPLCLDMRVSLSKEPRNRNTIKQVLITSDGKVSRFQGKSCISVPANSERFSQIIERWNREMVHCTLAVKDDVMVVGSQCELSYRLRGVTRADQLVLYVTSNIITFSSAAIAEFDEAQFGAVVAHELGHYYRSHLTAASMDGDYNFFYQVEEVSSDAKHRPVADSNFAELGREVAAINLPSRSYRRIPGQKLRSELFRPIISLARIVDASFECSTPRSCDLSCEEFQGWMDHSDEFNELLGFPFIPITSSVSNTYRTFENKAMTCLESMDVDSYGTTDGSSISPKISSEFFMSALSDDHEIFERFLSDFHPTPNALESMLLVGDLLTRKIADNRQPLYQAAQSRLGYYTFEQEADELGMEWMMDIGHASHHALEVEFLYANMHDEIDLTIGVDLYPLTTPASECRDLYNDDWVDELGNEVFIPIADYQDAHHSSCYRAYNLSREIAIHGYQEIDGRYNEQRNSWSELRRLVPSWYDSESHNPEIRTYKPSRDSRSTSEIAETSGRLGAVMGMCAFNR